MPLLIRLLGNSERKTLMTKNNEVVAIYTSHADPEAAVKKLSLSGFDMKKLSNVGRDLHMDENVVDHYSTGDRMKCWNKQGSFGMAFGAESRRGGTLE
jgi:hypothetical protein